MSRDGFGRLVGVALLFAGLSSVIAPAASLAMEIRRSANGSEIHLSGQVEIGDFEKFEAVADTAEKNARVSLTSQGGRLDVALMIGARIRERGFSTAVPDGAICASACGYIWLAGASRFVEGNGRVGFHAVYVADDKHSISGSGNALVGSYMTRLGFSDPAIAYATEAGPSEMRWLAPPDASFLEIAVTWNKVASVDATWNIQLGAYPTRKAAQDALYAARRASPKLFANKQAFTVEVMKGQETKFRARMSGFTAKTAKRACGVLTRKGVDCAAVAPQSQVQEEAERQAKTEAARKAQESAPHEAQGKKAS